MVTLIYELDGPASVAVVTVIASAVACFMFSAFSLVWKMHRHGQAVKENKDLMEKILKRYR